MRNLMKFSQNSTRWVLLGVRKPSLQNLQRVTQLVKFKPKAVYKVWALNHHELLPPQLHYLRVRTRY